MNNCLLCGVGGQGTVLASRIIASAFMEKGLFARTAETIGMAQRGGSVVSHVRVGKTVPSPMIPPGKADLIIAFEPSEAVRNLSFLRKDGTVVLCDRPIYAVMSSLSGEKYDARESVAYIKSTIERCYAISGDEVERTFGFMKVLNVVLLGASAGSGALGLTRAELEAAVVKKVKPEFLEMNKRALAFGFESIGG